MKTKKSSQTIRINKQPKVNMYNRPGIIARHFGINEGVEGETIEQKLERIVNNNEPIKEGAPLIYTDRREGVRASTNVRTDRFEIAIEAADKIAKSYAARREEMHKAEQREGDGKPESIAGKSEADTNN